MNKHPDDYVFGLDKDIQNKLRAKFDPEKQNQAQAWIEAVTNTPFEGSFQEHLMDGVQLCEVINTIKAGSVKKINRTKMVFKQRENIVNYLEGCKGIGMLESDCFVTQDLFEGSNLVVVVDQIFSLGALSRKVDGFEGPYLGVKFADKNEREFSAETIAAGKTIISQQNAGSVAVEKEKGTDSILLYGKAGVGMGKSVGGVSQQNAGSIAVEKDKGTDSILMYGKAGAEMGKSVGGVSQQNAGSIAVEKEKGTDSILMYGKAGAEMGKASSAASQQMQGSIEVEKNKGTDMIVQYGKVGQEMGEASSDATMQNGGSIEVAKNRNLDAITR